MWQTAYAVGLAITVIGGLILEGRSWEIIPLTIAFFFLTKWIL